MDVVKLVLAGMIGYLLGSVNTSLVIGKIYGIDVRKHGSGNAGATNTLRTLGKPAAAMVGVGDVLKGVISCLIGSWIAGDIGLMLGGIGSIAGHNWPLYFGFKGGKGIFTSFAVVLMMDWKAGLILLGIFIVIVAVTRYVSLGSIVAAALFPVSGLVFKKGTEFTAFAVLLAALAIYRHHANIGRLIKGTEAKIGSKKNS